MRTVILSDLEELKRIMAVAKVPSRYQEVIISLYKQRCHDWCGANATACALEEALRDVVDEATYDSLLTKIARSGTMEKVMRETYPFD